MESAGVPSPDVLRRITMPLTLEGTRLLAHAMLHRFNLSDWSFGFDLSKVRAGVCQYTPKRITLSKYFVELNTVEETTDTILHEIAHAICGHEAGHGPVWQAVARAIGAKPEKCCGEGCVFPEGSWVANCPSCSKRITKHRKPRSIRLCRSCRVILDFRKDP
jgi:predicted SprT family Zn-dependent metalloprotease